MSIEDVNLIRAIAGELESGRDGSEARTFIDLAVTELRQFCDKKELEILRAKNAAS